MCRLIQQRRNYIFNICSLDQDAIDHTLKNTPIGIKNPMGVTVCYFAIISHSLFVNSTGFSMGIPSISSAWVYRMSAYSATASLSVV